MIYADIATSLGTGKIVAQITSEDLPDIGIDQDLNQVHPLQVTDTSKSLLNQKKEKTQKKISIFRQ